jgi:type III secretion system low calcium response chaperone LcrH/SycD
MGTRAGLNQVRKKEKTMDEQPLTEEDITPDKIHGYIKEAVKKLGPEFSKEEKIEHGKLLVKIFEKGMTPKEAMQISDEEVAQIYSFAYNQFTLGKFEDARELFKMLLTLELNGDFATALGICHHRLKDYEYAIHCYMLASFLDSTNPVPLFYAYDCFMNLNDEFSAGVMLCNVITKAEGQPNYENIKNDAQMRYDQLQKKIIENQVDAKK